MIATLAEIDERLTAMNRRLADCGAAHGAEPAIVEPEVVFIVGPPRSGTTLTSQLLASAGGLGYPSNIIARFWMDPVTGLALHRALANGEHPWKSELVSAGGRTRGAFEPHEFGFFWNRWFLPLKGESDQLEESALSKVEWDDMKKAVTAFYRAWGRPVVFKNSTWHSFMIGWLADIFPRSLFVICERDPLYTAQSILEQRRRSPDGEESWWSIRPREYADLKSKGVHEQVAGQVLAVRRCLREASGILPPERVFLARYEETCDAPGELVSRICRALFSWNPEQTKPETIRLAKLPHTDVPRLPARDLERLRAGLEALAQEWGAPSLLHPSTA